MKIKIKNIVLADGEEEVIEQIHDGQVVEKNGWIYLTYVDEEGFKNVIKLNDESLMLTRFAEQNTKMNFILGQAEATIMTPVGVQFLTTDTSRFEKNGNHVKIDYSLNQNNFKFADYKLEIGFDL
ncbi:hypothetical protein BG261_02455 [Floricoccus tropicus]|uniref:DUF1934 domain-containing protein n=1 Tax=Floricoccus tropicus TaxID=1859473 RepID=A0A1E8GPN6_9LACT|nr:DUF1934 domain-containing protein [Floricoccus tropicus]OFI49458.1 hypothetical protein BG261_02455 [Floricoccus tropicus]